MPKDELINMDNEAKISQIERAQTVTSTEAQFFADIIKDYFDNGRPSSFEKYERPLTTRLPQFLKFVEFDSICQKRLGRHGQIWPCASLCVDRANEYRSGLARHLSAFDSRIYTARTKTDVVRAKQTR